MGIANWAYVANNANSLALAVANAATLIGVDANNWSSYTSGYMGTNCPVSNTLNHAVVAVGYVNGVTVSNKKYDFWLVRVSAGLGGVLLSSLLQSPAEGSNEQRWLRISQYKLHPALNCHSGSTLGLPPTQLLSVVDACRADCADAPAAELLGHRLGWQQCSPLQGLRVGAQGLQEQRGLLHLQGQPDRAHRWLILGLQRRVC